MSEDSGLNITVRDQPRHHVLSIQRDVDGVNALYQSETPKGSKWKCITARFEPDTRLTFKGWKLIWGGIIFDQWAVLECDGVTIEVPSTVFFGDFRMVAGK